MIVFLEDAVFTTVGALAPKEMAVMVLPSSLSVTLALKALARLMRSNPLELASSG